jgi:hypothetical protein
MQRKFWFDENSVFARITEVSSKFIHLEENPGLSLKMSKEEKTEFVNSELNKLPKKMPTHIYLPTNPDTKIIEILPNSAVSLQSAKKVPFIVSFIGIPYNGPDSDYIVTTMNIHECVSNEVINYEYLIRLGINFIPSNDALSHASKFQCKSTQHTHFDGKGMLSNPNSYNYGSNIDQDENLSLNVPFIDIKIFNGKNNVEIIEKQVEPLESESENIELCVNDLSGCTVEEEFIYENIEIKISKNLF